MSKTAIICLARSRGQTERIIARLKLAGFAYSEISVLMPETDSNHDIGHVMASKAPEGTAAGGITGGIAGGVLGLLAGLGSLAIPGIVALVAAGPVMAALSGAALGAATGGIVGGLLGMGIPEIEAKVYSEKLQSGNFLVAVHAGSAGECTTARQIFKDVGAEDICTAGEAAVPRGDVPMNPDGQPPAYRSSGVID